MPVLHALASTHSFVLLLLLSFTNSLASAKFALNYRNVTESQSDLLNSSTSSVPVTASTSSLIGSSATSSLPVLLTPAISSSSTSQELGAYIISGLGAQSVADANTIASSTSELTPTTSSVSSATRNITTTTAIESEERQRSTTLSEDNTSLLNSTSAPQSSTLRTPGASVSGTAPTSIGLVAASSQSNASTGIALLQQNSTDIFEKAPVTSSSATGRRVTVYKTINATQLVTTTIPFASGTGSALSGSAPTPLGNSSTSSVSKYSRTFEIVGTGTVASCYSSIWNWYYASADAALNGGYTSVSSGTPIVSTSHYTPLTGVQASRVTTLCDGHPRAIGSAEYSGAESYLITKAGPRATFPLPVPDYPPPPCTIDVSDCASLWSQYAAVTKTISFFNLSTLLPPPCATTGTSIPFRENLCSVGQATVIADSAQLLYWPVLLAKTNGSSTNSSADPMCDYKWSPPGIIPGSRTASGPNTFVTGNVTITSPDVGIALSALQVWPGGCGPTIDTVITMAPDMVSTNLGRRVLARPHPINYNDFNWVCQDSRNPNGSWTTQFTSGETCYQDVPMTPYFLGGTKYDQYTLLSSYSPDVAKTLVIANDYSPLVMPDLGVRQVITDVFGPVALWYNGGVWDPPSALNSATAADTISVPGSGTTSTSALGATTPASAQPTASQPTPDPTASTTSVPPQSKTSSQQNVPASSTLTQPAPSSSNAATPAQPGSSSLNAAAPAQPGSSSSNAAAPAQPGSSSSNAAAPAQPGSSSANAAAPAQPGSSSSNAAAPAQPGSSSANAITPTASASDPNLSTLLGLIGQVGQQPSSLTVTAGNGAPASSPSSNAKQDSNASVDPNDTPTASANGASTAQAVGLSGGAAAPATQVSTQAVTLGGSVVTATATGSNVIINGATLTPGSTTTINGQQVSLGSSGLTVGSGSGASTIAVGSDSTAGLATTQTVTLGGSVVVATATGSNVIINGATLTPGSTTTINGQQVSLGSSGLVVGSGSGASTVAIGLGSTAGILDPAAITTQILDPTVVSSVAPRVAVVGGQTVTLGGSAKTINGQVVSLGTSGLVVSSANILTTIPVAPGSKDIVTIGTEAFTRAVGSGGVETLSNARTTMTLQPGSSAITIDGSVVSAAPTGLVIGVGKSGTTIPFASTAGNIVTIGSQTFTRNVGPNGLETLSNAQTSLTLSPGGKAVTVAGQLVSAASNGLFVSSSAGGATLLSGDLVTIGGEVFTIAFQGQGTEILGNSRTTVTLAPGGSAVTLNGETVSAGQSDLVMSDRSMTTTRWLSARPTSAGSVSATATPSAGKPSPGSAKSRGTSMRNEREWAYGLWLVCAAVALMALLR